MFSHGGCFFLTGWISSFEARSLYSQGDSLVNETIYMAIKENKKHRGGHMYGPRSTTQDQRAIRSLEEDRHSMWTRTTSEAVIDFVTQIICKVILNHDFLTIVNR